MQGNDIESVKEEEEERTHFTQLLCFLTLDDHFVAHGQTFLFSHDELRGKPREC